VKLYTNYRKLAKTFEVKISEGESIFEKNGKFEHDLFIGDALLQLRNANRISATVLSRN
jgi:hypothetical protein